MNLVLIQMISMIETLCMYDYDIFDFFTSIIDIKYFERQRVTLAFRTPIIMIQFHPHRM